jgi:hypothetical protein
MMAIGQLTANSFAGLYGNTNIEQEPKCPGRQMGVILPLTV